MATFRPNIDLLSIPGAKPLTLNDGTPENPKNVAYICIPAALNEIDIERSSHDEKRLTAYLSLLMRPLNQKYIDSIVANRQRRGDAVDMSKIESHEVTLNHTSDFIKAWTAAVAAKVLKEHPEWAGQNPNEASPNGPNDLYYEVRRVINKRIGKGYPVMAQKPTPAPVPMNSFGAPAGVAPYEAGPSAMFAPPAQPGAGGEATVEDLPF